MNNKSNNIQVIKKEIHSLNYDQNRLWDIELNFNNPHELIDHIILNSSIPDAFTILNVPFTMEEYDLEGICISWLNKKLMIRIEIIWNNRYSDISSVKSFSINKAYSYRSDINYIE